MMEWSLLHTTLNNGESRSKACLSHLIILGNRKAKLQGWKKGLVIKLSLQDRPSYFQLCHVSTSASFDTSSLDSIYITFPGQEQNIISSPYAGNIRSLINFLQHQQNLSLINGQSKRRREKDFKSLPKRDLSISMHSKAQSNLNVATCFSFLSPIVRTHKSFESNFF